MTQTTETAALWRDPAASAEERARDLLSRMTKEEKLRQLGSTWPNAAGASGDVAPMQSSQDQAAPFDEAIAGGLGQLTRPFGTAPIVPEEGQRILAELQRHVMAANRFGIPAVAHEECLTGFTAWQATVYPTPLAWGATFDPALIERMASRIGFDMAGLGIHQGLAPVLDVVRDYRWGRVEETIGEDPYLVGEIAAGYVRGLQSAGIIATLKHFAGYSASRGARNHAPVSMGPREFADVILPPFEKAVVQAGVRSVMNSYTDVDGVPAAVDETILTTILRDRWGFAGTVVSDYWAIPFVASTHNVAVDAVDAGAQTLRAGIDVELPHTLGYDDRILSRVDEDLIDRAASRVLTQKAELGMLDPSWRPSEPSGPVDLDSPSNRALARRVAERSVVLLSNDGVLPLSAGSPRIAVVGPTADDPGCLFGCYSFPNHVMPNHPELPIGVNAPSVLEAVRSLFGEDVVHERGVDVVGGDDDGIAAAVQVAREADTVILTVGDRSGMFGHGTSGEGCDALDLRLPGRQEELVRSVLDTGADVILVVISGRPYAVGEHVARARAALQAFFPGEEGAAALTDVIAGLVNPGGRLPVQIPGIASSQPGTYLAAPLALKSDGVSNLDPTPAFPFGFGLSYTTFTATDVNASAHVIDTAGRLEIEATITNTGSRAGRHVAQLYVSHQASSIAVPVRRLIGFAGVELEAGQSRTIVFDVAADHFAFTGRDLTRVVEPGEIRLTVAAHAADPGTPIPVTVTGSTRSVDHTRELTVPHRLRLRDDHKA